MGRVDEVYGGNENVSLKGISVLSPQFPIHVL